MKLGSYMFGLSDATVRQFSMARLPDGGVMNDSVVIAPFIDDSVDIFRQFCQGQRSAHCDRRISLR